MKNWQIVTNGKRFRLRSNDGNFLEEIVACHVMAITVPAEFATYQKAAARIEKLEQEERDNTWVLAEAPYERY